MDGVYEKRHQANRLLAEKQRFFHGTDKGFGVLYYGLTRKGAKDFSPCSRVTDNAGIS